MLGQLRDGRPELCDDVLERPAVACVPVNRLNTPAHLAISFARTRRTTRLVRVARTAHRLFAQCWGSFKMADLNCVQTSLNDRPSHASPSIALARQPTFTPSESAWRPFFTAKTTGTFVWKVMPTGFRVNHISLSPSGVWNVTQKGDPSRSSGCILLNF